MSKVEGFQDLLDFQKYQDKQLQFKRAEEKTKQRLDMLLLERDFLSGSLKQVEQEINKLNAAVTTPVKIPKERRGQTTIAQQERAIVEFIKQHRGVKYEQLRKYFQTTGLGELPKTWMVNLVRQGIIYKEGKTRAAMWYITDTTEKMRNV